MATYDYFSYDIDFQQLRCDTTLSQFRYDDDVLNGFTGSIAIQAYELFYQTLQTLNDRDLENARDYNLEVIGKWVGESRSFGFFKKINYFAPDTIYTPDSAPAFVVGGRQFGAGDVDDETFRRNIKARIFKNHVKYGSIPEIINFAKIALDTDISLRNRGAFDWDLLISSDTDAAIVEALQSKETTNFYDESYYLPLPIGRRLVGTIFLPSPAFIADKVGHGADVGKAAVRV